MNKDTLIIGYSGHAYVLIDIFNDMGKSIVGYCDTEKKSFNPYNLQYYGTELGGSGIKAITEYDYFIAIGSNSIRHRIQQSLDPIIKKPPTNAIHSSAIIGSKVSLGFGIMIAQNATINPLSKIGNGTVCNTGCIIEHEVEIGAYSFIAPGATILGDVKIGDNCFIGANTVILQNVKIGDNCTIGAGTVVIKDIPPNSKVVGNPQRFI